MYKEQLSASSRGRLCRYGGLHGGCRRPRGRSVKQTCRRHVCSAGRAAMLRGSAFVKRSIQPSKSKNPPRPEGLGGFLVRVAGFEPTASWTRTKRDTKLRHTRRFCVSPNFELSHHRSAARPRYNRNFVSALSGCKCLTAQRPLSKLRHTRRLNRRYYLGLNLVIIRNLLFNVKCQPAMFPIFARRVSSLYN